MTTLDIVCEPIGSIYAGILALAGEVCSSFSLVWTDTLLPNDSALRFAHELQPYLIREEQTNEWPGTKLLDGQATVRHYRVRPGSIRVLMGVGGLYAWLLPDHPEDLAFYLADGATWLGSIAHERDAWFTDSPGLEAILRERVPDLELNRAEVAE